MLRILLACGIISTFVYILLDAISASLYKGYSYVDQTVSELSAIGAPTKPLWNTMSLIFNPLLIAFGIGVIKAAGKKRALRISGILLVTWGLLGFVWLLFPMNMRGSIGSTSDTMHLVMTGITIPLMIALILFGSGATGKKFRIYSILTIVMMAAFGSYVGSQASRVAAQLTTPFMGIMERVVVFSPQIWTSVLAIILLEKYK